MLAIECGTLSGPAPPVFVPLRRPLGAWQGGVRIPALSRLPVPATLVRKSPPLLVARDLEPFARITMFATGAPAGSAVLALLPSGFRSRTFVLRRLPQASASEPQHRGIWMPDLQLPECREQFV